MKGRLLTNIEMELFRKAVYWKSQYLECTPEVGPGSSLYTIVKELADSLSFEIDEDDIAEVCEIVTGS